jgi:cytochrome P450
VGAALARLEVTVAVRTLLALAPNYEVDEGGLVRIRSSMFRGYEHVPVSVGG